MLFYYQIKAILWKNWLLKRAHFYGLLAEIFLPVIFMALLILIKSVTDKYDSPNVAYYCGNTYPWFYNDGFDLSQGSSLDNQVPFVCTQKPDSCHTDHYFLETDKYKVNGYSVSGFGQYGYILSSATSGQSTNPFYSFTLAEESAIYNNTLGSVVDNPSLPFCEVLHKVHQNDAILALAPREAGDADLAAEVDSLRAYLLGSCGFQVQQQGQQEGKVMEEKHWDADLTREMNRSWHGGGSVTYSLAASATVSEAARSVGQQKTLGDSVVVFSSSSKLHDYVTDRDYDDKGYKEGKVAFAVLLNSVNRAKAQWDYTLRVNYTSSMDQDDDTVACLYKDCEFTYSIPSTKYNTQNLNKPQLSDFLYGYSFSGFATLQLAVDQYIFNQYYSAAAAAVHAAVDAAAAAAAQDGVRIMASVGLLPTSSYKTDDFQYIIASTLGIFFMLSFLYPVSRLIRALVLEKEARLKEGMKMMGLTETVYNLSWLITALLQMTLVCVLITLVTASSVFQYSDKVLIFFYFEAFSLAVISMCFLLATLFSSSKAASLLGPMLFFGSFFPYYALDDDQYDITAKGASCLLAPTCFALGADVLAAYEGGLVGVQAANINEQTSNFTYSLCVSMLLVDALLYGGLAWYLDKVLPSEHGTQLPLYFPLLPSYWCGVRVGSAAARTRREEQIELTHAPQQRLAVKGRLHGWRKGLATFGLRLRRLARSVWVGCSGARRRNTNGGQAYQRMHQQQVEGSKQVLDRGGRAHFVSAAVIRDDEEGIDGGDDQAKEEEEEAVEAQRRNQPISGSGVKPPRCGYFEPPATELQRLNGDSCLHLRGLRKVFPNPAGGDERVAVQGLSMTLFPGQVTVLLGHNGAGKTTTINMLVGLMSPSAGEAVFPGGLSTTTDMARIRGSLGVCPQHNILFPELTAMQHLQMFAAFKGVPAKEVDGEASRMLAEVGLLEKAQARSATLSGGQKRKLSLGIALIGGSRVVVLDEPTSGMDPFSRRSTWNIIQRNKAGRVVLLTTHFMDEADLLGDRVAIMAHGSLQCLGSPLFLKRQFGVGYTLTVVKRIDGSACHRIATTDSREQQSTRSGEVCEAGGGSPSSSALLSALVLKHVPSALPLCDVGAEQSFRLPFSATAAFVDLFRALDRHVHHSQSDPHPDPHPAQCSEVSSDGAGLCSDPTQVIGFGAEEKKSRAVPAAGGVDEKSGNGGRGGALLQIAEYGISVTTLEEVFIRVGEQLHDAEDVGAEAGAGAERIISPLQNAASTVQQPIASSSSGCGGLALAANTADDKEGVDRSQAHRYQEREGVWYSAGTETTALRGRSRSSDHTYHRYNDYYHQQQPLLESGSRLEHDQSNQKHGGDAHTHGLPPQVELPVRMEQLRRQSQFGFLHHRGRSRSFSASSQLHWDRARLRLHQQEQQQEHPSAEHTGDGHHAAADRHVSFYPEVRVLTPLLTISSTSAPTTGSTPTSAPAAGESTQVEHSDAGQRSRSGTGSWPKKQGAQSCRQTAKGRTVRKVTVTKIEEVQPLVDPDAEDSQDVAAEEDREASGGEGGTHNYSRSRSGSGSGSASSRTSSVASSAGLGKIKARRRLDRAGMTFGRHFSALLRKRAIYGRRDRRMIICQLVLPVVLVIVGVSLLLLKPDYDQPNLKLSAGKYNHDLPRKHRNYVPFYAEPPAETVEALRLLEELRHEGASDAPQTGGAVSAAASDGQYVGALMQERFNGDAEDGVLGVAVPLQESGLDGSESDKFHSCSLGASALYNMSQFALQASDIDSDLYASDEHGSAHYGAITIAGTTTLEKLDYNILVNGSAVHGVGVYVNEVHSSFLQVLTGLGTARIITHNHPLPQTYKQQGEAATADAFVVSLFCMIASCFVPASFAAFLVKERECKAKHQQVISGVSLLAYWTSSYLWDVASYLPTAALIIAVFYAFEVDAYTEGPAASAAIGLLLLYGPSTAAITYVISFLFSSHSTAQISVLFFNFVTGLCLVSVNYVLTMLSSTSELSVSLRYLFRIFPAFCLGDGLLQLALCTDGRDCPNIDFSDGYDFEGVYSLHPFSWDTSGLDLLCMGLEVVVYFAIAVGIEYLMTFPTLLAWIDAVDDPDWGDSERVVRVKKSIAGGDSGDDDDVAAERLRVLRGEADSEVVCLKGLRKVYPVEGRYPVRVAWRLLLWACGGRALVRWWRNHSSSGGHTGSTARRAYGSGDVEAADGAAAAVADEVCAPLLGDPHSSSTEERAERGEVGKQQQPPPSHDARKVQRSGRSRCKVAVHGLSFGIPRGECFGFLGINGAGKTTTLSILSGEFPATGGAALIDGHSIASDQLSIRQRIGYCPQFDALLDLLTVREHLELFGRIKGLVGAGLEAVVRRKLVQLDLKDFEHKAAGGLSGGNKRKLSVAIATIGEPSIIFLDEPSTGMDPVARRFMWEVIARMCTQDAECSIILTTHSMEEAEALCSRIGVMVNGRLRCLGSAQHLKARFGRGFEVTVKLQAPSDEQLRSAVRPLTGLLLRTSPPHPNTTRSTVAGAYWGAEAQAGEVVEEETAKQLLVQRLSSWAQLREAATLLGDSERLAEVAPRRSGALLAEAMANATAAATTTTANVAAHKDMPSTGTGRVVAPPPGPATSGGAAAACGPTVRDFLEWWLLEDRARRLHCFLNEQFGIATDRADGTECLTASQDASSDCHGSIDRGGEAQDSQVYRRHRQEQGQGQGKVQLLERSTAQNFRFRIPASATPATQGSHPPEDIEGEKKVRSSGVLADVFAQFEAQREALFVEEYSVGQTTLEQVFNHFAAQQDNPEVAAMGEAEEEEVGGEG